MLKGHTTIVYALAYSPDGTRLTSASEDGTVKLWDVPTGDEILTLHGSRNHSGAFIDSIAFSPDGRTLAAASADGVVKLWRAATEEEVQAAAGNGGSAR